MVTPELKWPTTNLTPTEMPCFGSETSSPTDRTIFSPLIPPAALMSAAACSAPFCSCAPKAAFGPVIGPATPIRISAHALPPNAIRAVRATADNSDFFIETLPLAEWAWMMLSCDAHPYRRKVTLPISRRLSRLFTYEKAQLVNVSGALVLGLPGEQRRFLVKPAVLRHHLVGAR